MKAQIIGTVIAVLIVFGLYAATEGDSKQPTRSAAPSQQPAIPTFKVQ